VIVAWQDCRNGCWEIYAQRIDSLGYARWGVNGVLAASQSSNKENLVMVGDGAGGAIIAWVDDTPDRTGATSLNIYAQKIDASGNLSAALTGIPVCLEQNDQYQLVIASDGSGGAIVAWTDWRSWDPAHPMYETTDVYGAHIDHEGSVGWKRLLVMGFREAATRALFPDGSGGVILSYGNGFRPDYPGIVRIDRTVNAVWNVCPTEVELVISDGAGGVIGTWISADSTRGQRIDSLGVLHWGSGGKTILPGMIRSYGVSDGRGGAIFIGSGFAQRVDSNGDRVWSPNGVSIEVDGPLIADGFGGAIIGSAAVQRVDSSGNVLWRPGGQPTVAGSGAQLVSDGAGGVILIFGSGNIYAQRVDAAGHTVVATLLQDYAADFSGDQIAITWTLSEIDEHIEFSVERATAPDGPFIELPSNAMKRDGLSFTFTDSNWQPNVSYWYRVEYQIGNKRTVLFETGPIATPALPLTLYQNSPNPFNPSTTIKYYLPEKCRVRLEIYDISGRRIASLVSGEQEKGRYAAEWNGKDDRGGSVVSGVYFYKLAAGKETISRKMVLIR
jgi:hypothetical protein